YNNKSSSLSVVWKVNAARRTFALTAPEITLATYHNKSPLLFRAEVAADAFASYYGVKVDDVTIEGELKAGYLWKIEDSHAPHGSELLVDGLDRPVDPYQPADVWKRELESVEELIELEPDRPLMTKVHMLRETGDRNGTVTIPVLNRLTELDADRQGFYADHVSDIILESAIVSTSETSNELECVGKGLTRVAESSVLSLKSIVNLQNNSLRLIPCLTAVVKLNLDSNLITATTNLEWMPCLSVLSLRDNLIDEKGIDGLMKSCEGLIELNLDGNPVFDGDDGAKEQIVRRIRSMVPTLKKLNGVDL
ncbi:hypothetical protein HDU76_008167, partial [Blyttiomyces sp. JEL0837]